MNLSESARPRRGFPRTGLGIAALCLSAVLPALSSRALAEGTPVDITFYQVGDTHYRAFDATNGNANATNRNNLRKMMELTPSTAMPGAGTVGTPGGVIACGDLLNSGSETDPASGLVISKTATLEKQWANFIKDFGSLGNEPDSIVKWPVFEGYGNHDQDGFLKQVSDNIAARATRHPNIAAQSSDGHQLPLQT